MSHGERYGVIWDMDGTLVDTAELHFAAWEQICRELGRPFSRADFAATFGRRNPEIFDYLFGKRFSEEKIAALGDHKEELYRAAVRRMGVEPLPGARQLLAGLHAAGLLQAIGSSAPRANLDLILEVTGIGSFFKALASMEDTQRGKPDPQVFLVAAEKLGVPGNCCLVFEDAVAGVQAARAGGMRCIAVSFVGHHPPSRLREAGADLVVDSLEKVAAAQVLELLRRSEP